MAGADRNQLRAGPARGWPGLLLLGALTAQAGETGWDRVWDHASLYSSETGWLRSVEFSGRLHYDLAWIDADQGSWHGSDLRRLRLGGKLGFANDWLLHIEASVDYNSLEDELDSSLTDAYLAWGRDTRFQLLKQSAGFTLDGATSSKRLLTPERNNLSNNLWFTAEYFTGFTVAGDAAPGLSYKLGVFSADGDEEISDFGTTFFTTASATWNGADRLGLDTAQLRVDYVYNDYHEESGTADFENIVSLSSQWQQGAWGLRTDLSSGSGHRQQSDLRGLVLMPHYDITERWQLVMRYTYLDSDGANGIRFGRYEREVVEGRGDRYEEVFAGLNLFLYGHKFKLQAGLQWADMDDEAGDGGRYNGLGFSTVLRSYW